MSEIAYDDGFQASSDRRFSQGGQIVMTQVQALTYAVRFRLVARYLSQIALILAALQLVPVVVSLWYAEYDLTLAYALVVGALLVAGLPSVFWPAREDVQSNEALVITALAFALTPVITCYPMVRSGLPTEDALFEAVSAVTTTGLTTLTSVERLPRTFLFARSWMQWYGGLGIVVLSVAVLFTHGMLARRLVASETPIENLVTTTKIHARRMLAVYAVLTAAAMALVLMTGTGAFAGLTHVLSAVSTGGFSSLNANLAGFESWLSRGTLMVAAFCGALALPLYYQAYREGVGKLISDPEVRGLVLAAIIASFLLALTFAATNRDDGLGHALVIGFSAQTGTGFTSLPVSELTPSSKAALLAPMVIGGSIGSTAGGIKIWRLLFVLGMIRLAIHRASMPRHAVPETRVWGRRVEEADLQRALMVAGLFALVIFSSWLVFVAFGHDPLDALFEVVSATATVGLSTGISASTLDPLLKLVLCADMLLGRLEVFAFLILIYPPTWIGKRTEVS